MALDLHGFTAPVDQYGGLYQVASDMNKRNAAQIEAKDKAAAKQASDAKFLANYFGDKNKFTGSLYDPIKTKLIGDALDQAMDLSKKGSSVEDILMATAPLVNKVNDYEARATMFSDKKTKFLEQLKANGQKGIDIPKLSDEIDNAAFYDIDPKTGQKVLNVDKADPSHNYGLDVLNNGDVFTNEGFGDFVGKAGKNVVNHDVVLRDANGKIRQTKIESTSPNFMDLEKDKQGVPIGYVPKYTTATDDGSVLLHDFLGDKGDVIKEPVRLLSDDVFNQLPTTAKAYLKQEATKYAKLHNIDPSSPQVDNLIKALAYDEVRNNAKQSSTYKELSKLEQPVTKNTTNINMSSKKEDNTWIPPYLNDLKSHAVNNLVPLDATLSKALTKEGVAPDLLGIQDGKWKPIFFKRKDGVILRQGDSENGTPIIDEIRSQPITDNQMILQMGGQTGVKQKNIEMINRPQRGGNTKTYNVGGKEITEDMINKGAAKYKMTPEQYKASIGIK